MYSVCTDKIIRDLLTFLGVPLSWASFTLRLKPSLRLSSIRITFVLLPHQKLIRIGHLRTVSDSCPVVFPVSSSPVDSLSLFWGSHLSGVSLGWTQADLGNSKCTFLSSVPVYDYNRWMETDGWKPTETDSSTIFVSAYCPDPTSKLHIRYPVIRLRSTHLILHKRTTQTCLSIPTWDDRSQNSYP